MFLPSHIFGSESLPSSLLAQTYIKDGLSDIDRYHAKRRYLKRAFPLLKIPKQYRCEYCIEGKIHKFGHGPCKPGERTEYPHSGPYARSVGGARYSQILWTVAVFIWGF